MEFYRSHVMICGGTGCTSSGSQRVQEEFWNRLREKGLEKEIKLVQTGCFGLCSMGPIVIVYPEGTFYTRVKVEDVHEIVEEHLLKGKVVKRLLQDNPHFPGFPVQSLEEMDFYHRQRRIALRHCGFIQPESIEEYIGMDGYLALEKVLTEMMPEQVVEEIKKAGLRGRGGAGFLTAEKWSAARSASGKPKYVICNSDEGDPGAFMGRSILEGDPHSVLEGLAIAGYAVGASVGMVYVRAEYAIAVKRLQTAIKAAEQMGLLGKDIFHTGFDFHVEIRLGAGGFVSGEETALIASIEGRRAEPMPRPPYPTYRGVFGKPTVINNVETLVHIPPILLNGASWFSSIGTEKSRGTKIFALGGKVAHTGLVEVPLNTTIREIVYGIGGGVPFGRKFKAAQTGGPSGGLIPASLLDMPVDFESLSLAGSIMGSGGIVVMDEENCMVDIAKFFLEFLAKESCGKCPPCRIGTERMLEILNKITEGNGEPEDLENLENLAVTIKTGALCALGRTAPNPVLSTLKYFKKEYEAHIYDKKCPAGVCKSLLRIEIDSNLCRGCTSCAKVCPVGAIRGERKEVHTIDPKKCMKCGACIEKCPFKAISKQ